MQPVILSFRPTHPMFQVFTKHFNASGSLFLLYKLQRTLYMEAKYFSPQSQLRTRYFGIKKLVALKEVNTTNSMNNRFATWIS